MVTRLFRVGLLFVLLANLPGCTEQHSRTVHIGLAKAATVFDPRLASDAVSERINELLYASLIVLDRQRQPQSGMADWQHINDRHYRLVLREDRATFWNGRLPTATDVKATYKSVLDSRLGSPHAAVLSHITDIQVVDPQTIDFRLKRVDPRFISRLRIGILPAAILSNPDKAIESPMGSGPFKYIARQVGDTLDIQRRSDGLRLQFQPVADPTMRTLKLLRGEIDLLQNDLPAELFAYRKAQQGVEVEDAPGTTFAYIGFNLLDPVVGDQRIRKAIAHAIDREAIITYLFHGHAQKAESVLPPGHWAGDPASVGMAFSPEKARELLAQAGYTTERPLTLSYKTSTDPFRLRIASVFKAQLARVGIDLQIQSFDWGTFFGDIKAGNFQMYSLAWVGISSPDIFRYIYHSQSVPPAGANRGRYQSSEIDKLIEQAEQAEGKPASILYRRIQQIVHDEMVYVPLWYESNLAAFSRRLRGYQPQLDGNYRSLGQVSLHDG